MREIKFKAWIVKDRVMFFSDSLISDFFIWLKDWEKQKSPYILMQYTGLKDKNGVEIYEGDLLRLYDNTKGNFEVVFRNSYIGGWVLTERSNQEWLSLGARSSQNIEIIGNIHENPELLED